MVAIGVFLIVRALRARVYVGDVIQIGIRRILSDATLEILYSFECFMCLRPMAFALLDGRRRHIIRYYQMSILGGIFVANFDALQTCSATILDARFYR